MRFRIVWSLVIASSLIACNSGKTVTEGTASGSSSSTSTTTETAASTATTSDQAIQFLDELQDTTVIVRLEKSACYGSCPVFKFEVRANGMASYHGQQFVKHEGKFKKQLTKEELATIFSKAEAINFYQFDEVYDSSITDIPSSTIYLNKGTDKHQVYARFDVPAKLAEFEKWLSEWVMAIDWSKK